MKKCVTALILTVALSLSACTGGPQKPTPPQNQTEGDAGSTTTSLVTAPATGATPGHSPLLLKADPDAAGPGQTITLTLQGFAPHQLAASGPEGQAITAFACFAGCKQGRWGTITFRSASTDGTTVTGRYTLPLFLPDATGSPWPLASGAYELSLSCLTGDMKGCFGQTQASVQLQVSAPVAGMDWTALPQVSPEPLPAVGGFSTDVTDPTDARHRVVCHTGSPTRVEMPDIPHLAVTHDAGKTWEHIPLTYPPFMGQHNIVGCRTAALDPQHADTFYGEDSGNTGNRGGGMTQAPYVTWDHGKSWQPVPLPDGLPGADPGRAFRGFTMASDGVTAWFSTATLDQPVTVTSQIAGLLTTDGGHAWRRQSLTCGEESASGCARQLSTWFLLGQNGLLISSDAGNTWDWARYMGSPIAALSFWRLGNGTGRYLALGAGVSNQFLPLLYSADAGLTWEPVQVPALPGGWLQNSAAPAWEFPHMQLLPDRSMLAHRWDGQPEDHTWYRLRPGRNEWEAALPPP